MGDPNLLLWVYESMYSSHYHYTVQSHKEYILIMDTLIIIIKA